MGYAEAEIIKTEILLITPEMASRYLQKNDENRPITEKNWRNFVQIIQNGDWRTTHQGIAINERGAIVDGQHRLLAIVFTGIPVRMMVSTYKGDATALFLPLDLARKRTPSDITGIPRRLLEPIRYLVREMSGSSGAEEGKLLRFVDRHPEALEYLDTKLNGSNTAIFSSAVVRSAILLSWLGGYGDYSDQYKSLIYLDIANLTAGSQFLYKKLLSFKGLTGGEIFRKKAFALTFEVASNPNFCQSRIHPETLEKVYQKARGVFAKINGI